MTIYVYLLHPKERYFTQKDVLTRVRGSVALRELKVEATREQARDMLRWVVVVVVWRGFRVHVCIVSGV